MEIKKALNWRYATKKFDLKPVPDGKIDIILESGRLAPSSFGLQPWKFFVVKDKKIREEIRKAAWNQSPVTEASHLIVVTVLKEIGDEEIQRYIESIASTRNVPKESLADFEGMIKSTVKKMNPEQLLAWNQRQAYIALGFMIFTAAQEEVDALPIEGFDPDAIDKILVLTEKGLRSTVMLAIGYRAADDKYAELAKVRYEMKDVIKAV